MAAIVREDAPPMEERVPPPLRWIVDRCLAKEPGQRYESMRDLFYDLRNGRDRYSETHTSAALAPVPTRGSRRLWDLLGALAACLLLGALVTYFLVPRGQDIGKYRFTPFATDANSPYWSPDGKALTYAVKVNGIFQVFVRYLNSPVPVQLTHYKLDIGPFGWSADKSHLIVGEVANAIANPSLLYYKLYSLPIVGGELEYIMDADCTACDLSKDGKAFATFVNDGARILPLSLSGSGPKSLLIHRDGSDAPELSRHRGPCREPAERSKFPRDPLVLPRT